MTSPPGGLHSFTRLHHPHLHSSLGMHREESAILSIFEFDEGRWERGPSQVWLLWKVHARAIHGQEYSTSVHVLGDDGECVGFYGKYEIGGEITECQMAGPTYFTD